MSSKVQANCIAFLAQSLTDEQVAESFENTTLLPDFSDPDQSKQTEGQEISAFLIFFVQDPFEVNLRTD